MTVSQYQLVYIIVYSSKSLGVGCWGLKIYLLLAECTWDLGFSCHPIFLTSSCLLKIHHYVLLWAFLLWMTYYSVLLNNKTLIKVGINYRKTKKCYSETLLCQGPLVHFSHFFFQFSYLTVSIFSQNYFMCSDIIYQLSFHFLFYLPFRNWKGKLLIF